MNKIYKLLGVGRKRRQNKVEQPDVCSLRLTTSLLLTM